MLETTNQYKISLTWIKAIKGDDFPKVKHDFQGSVATWGRDEIYPELLNMAIYSWFTY